MALAPGKTAVETVQLNKEQIIAEMLAFQVNMDLLAANCGPWQEQYPGNWIAVDKGELVAVEEDPDALVALLREKAIPPARVLIFYLPPNGVEYVLYASR